MMYRFQLLLSNSTCAATTRWTSARRTCRINDRFSLVFTVIVLGFVAMQVRGTLSRMNRCGGGGIGGILGRPSTTVR